MPAERVEQQGGDEVEPQRLQRVEQVLRVNQRIRKACQQQWRKTSARSPPRGPVLSAPLRDLTEPLSAANFLIEHIREPSPSEALKRRDPRGYEQLSRVPAFIFVRARNGE